MTLEFHQNDDTEVSLMEVRFYVPPSQSDERQDPVEVREPGLSSFYPLFFFFFSLNRRLLNKVLSVLKACISL